MHWNSTNRGNKQSFLIFMYLSIFLLYGNVLKNPRYSEEPYIIMYWEVNRAKHIIIISTTYLSFGQRWWGQCTCSQRWGQFLVRLPGTHKQTSGLWRVRISFWSSCFYKCLNITEFRLCSQVYIRSLIRIAGITDIPGKLEALITVQKENHRL